MPSHTASRRPGAASPKAPTDPPGLTADLLPDPLATRVAGMIDQGMTAMKRTLERSGAGL
jgi:hypothetical protein